MKRNDLLLLTALGILIASSLLTWSIVEGAWTAPGNTGWIYGYQTLIGVGAALAGAYLTIAMMRREQRQQRDHFEKQMEIMNRPDRLRVSRETARLIPTLRGGLAEVTMNAKLAVAAYRGNEMRSQRLIRILNELSATLSQRNFADLLPLLDDDFTEHRGKLKSRVLKLEEQWLKAFVGREISDATEIEILRSNNLVHFPEVEHEIEAIIEYLQSLRSTYNLPRLGLRHDESWRVLQGHLEPSK